MPVLLGTVVKILLGVNVVLASSNTWFSTACPFDVANREFIRRLQQRNVSDVCEDILPSVEESPIKECSVLLGIIPCGTMLEEQGVLVDVVCAKSCGTCEGSEPTSTGTTSSQPPLFNETEDSTFQPYTRTFHPESAKDPSVEYTVFCVGPDYVDVMTSIPVDTEWVGYMLLPTTPPDKPETQEFPLLMFVFQFDPNDSDKVVASRAWHFVYAGPPPSAMKDVLPVEGAVVECTQELESLSGGLCQYDSTREMGDFMFTFASFLIITRERYEDPDFEVYAVETASDLSARRIQWRVPSYHFLKVDDLRIRYATKPLSYETRVMVAGLPYHGFGYTSHAPFSLADRPNEERTAAHTPSLVDGYIQHSYELTDDDSKMWIIGGSFGWNFPPTGTATSYQSLVVPPGTTLRFVYGFPLQVVSIGSLEEFETCEFTNYTVVGNPLGSPLDLTMRELGDYYYAAPAGQTDYAPCMDGLKIHVRVSNDEERFQEESGAFGRFSLDAKLFFYVGFLFPIFLLFERSSIVMS